MKARNALIAPGHDVPGRHTAGWAPTSRTTGRVEWMDTLRGTAILLLILWHASSIPVRFGFDMPTWLFLVNEAFLPWRMPTLMFLSGLLLAGSLRKPASVYIVGKVRNLLWPYALWAAVYLSLFPGSGEAISDPMSWFGAGYLWFILYLFAYYLVAPLVVRAPWWIALPAFTVGAILIPHPSPQKICFFAVFFFAGHYARTLIPFVLNAPRTLVGAVGLVAAAFTAASVTLSAVTGAHFFEFAPASIVFVLALIALSIRVAHALGRRASKSPLRRGIAWIGRNSVVFYLTHFPLMIIACVIARQTADALGLWIVGVCCATALLGGVPLALANRHWSVSWLFRAPSLPQGRTLITARPRTVGGAA